MKNMKIYAGMRFIHKKTGALCQITFQLEREIHWCEIDGGTQQGSFIEELADQVILREVNENEMLKSTEKIKDILVFFQILTIIIVVTKFAVYLWNYQ